jgi:hypothetical protein
MQLSIGLLTLFDRFDAKQFIGARNAAGAFSARLS